MDNIIKYIYTVKYSNKPHDFLQMTKWYAKFLDLEDCRSLRNFRANDSNIIDKLLYYLVNKEKEQEKMRIRFKKIEKILQDK